ncbi:MAG TPA: hypothetical protein VLK65_01740 [Vicinamibacteria bacterium]|nr:hypothetical protein [Vicinamibacteria bacterium]
MRLGSADEHEQISMSKGDNSSQRFSRDGKRIVFQSGRAGHSAIWLHDWETGTEQPLTSPQGQIEDRTPEWSPDGAEVVFLSNREGPFQLWVTSVEGGAPRRMSEQAIPSVGLRDAESEKGAGPSGAETPARLFPRLPLGYVCRLKTLSCPRRIREPET